MTRMNDRKIHNIEDQIKFVEKFIYINKNNISIKKNNKNRNNKNEITNKAIISILISVPIFNKENYNFALQNRDIIVDKVLIFLNNYDRFKNLNIKINNLNLTKMTYRKDGYIHVIFDYDSNNLSNYDINNYY